MKQELFRLRTLIQQLISQLQVERDERVKLENQLKVSKAELEHVRSQLGELRRKQSSLVSLISQMKENNNA